jgi:hypothetical protein
MKAEESVDWLQGLVNILAPDIKEGDEQGSYYIEFSSCCYLDHTIRLIRDHFEKADFSNVPRVHTGTFNYDTNEWEGE